MSADLGESLRAFLRGKGIDPDNSQDWAQEGRPTDPRSKEEIQEENRQLSWASRLFRCNVPDRYKAVPMDMALPAEVADWRGSPWSVTIMGNAGCGKSYMAVHMLARIARDNGPRSYFYDATVVWQEIKDEFGSDRAGVTMNRLRHADVLLLDDVGADRVTDFQAEQLSIVLTDRYNNVRPTILTTNAPSLGSFLSPRLVSRLTDGIILKMTGKDRRGRKP